MEDGLCKRDLPRDICAFHIRKHSSARGVLRLHDVHRVRQSTGRRAPTVTATQSGTKTRASPGVTPGRQFNSLANAVNAGLVRGCPPFPDGVDLFGFFNDIKQTEAQRYADVEITHGRVGMLAALGFIVQEKFHPLFSGDGGPAIDQIPALPVWLWGVMAGGIGLAESYRINTGFRELDGTKLKAETALKPGYVPGDLGFDPLNLAPEDPAEFRAMQEKELLFSRVGMISAALFLLQEGISGVTWGTAWGIPDF